MRYILVLFVFFILNSLAIRGQDSLKQSIKDTLPIISNRYIGGGEELRHFIARNVDYPIRSMTNQTVGFSISSITISPEGKIKRIEIINPVDYDIDQEMIRVLLKTNGCWKPINYTSKDLTYYIQVAFKLVDCDYNYTPIHSSNFMDALHVTTMFPSIFNDFKTDEYLQNRLSKSLKKEKYKIALESINEIVKRNPTKSQIYQLRIMINTKLKNDSLVQSDTKKMQYFSKFEPSKFR